MSRARRSLSSNTRRASGLERARCRASRVGARVVAGAVAAAAADAARRRPSASTACRRDTTARRPRRRRRRRRPAPRGRARSRRNRGDADGAGGDEAPQAPPAGSSRIARRRRALLARARRSADRAPGAARRKPASAPGATEPALQQVHQARRAAARATGARTACARSWSVCADGAADAQRVVERLRRQPADLGVVGHAEARIEVGLERELAQQRQAERVDGADRRCRRRGRAARATARVRRRPRCASRRRCATMRSRISAAAFRVNVIARMCAGSTPASSRFR